MTRRERREDRDLRKIAADAVGLKYGPSECRPQDAEDHVQVYESRSSSTTATIPVQYVLTRNRGILETLAT